MLEALFTKSIALELVIKYKQALETAEQGLKFLNNLTKNKQEEYQYQKAKLLGRKGICFYQLNDNKKTSKYCRQALKEFERIDNTQGIALMLSFIGLVHNKKRNHTKAIEFLEESLALYKELKDDYHCAIIYHYLGRVYTAKGELNRALDYMNKTLPIIRSLGDDYRIATTLLYLIPILIERGKYEKAKEYTKQCLELIEKLNYTMAIGILYYRLIRIALFQEDITEARKNNEILYSLRERYNSPDYYINFYQLSNALILKHEMQITGLAKAEEIFRNLMEGDYHDLEITFEAMYYLCEILLLEFQTTSDINIINEVESLSKRILEYGKKEELARLRIKAYILRLLMLFVQEQNKEGTIDFREVDSLFNETQKMAESLGLKATTKQFSQQYFRLKNQKQIWDDFIGKYYSKNF